MGTTRQLTAVITKDGDMYVALCPEVDVASQGTTVEEARKNLIEAIELFFETADPSEIEERYKPELYVSRIEVGGE
ncbi:MAG: type II toxin-antitoxin system HicB family antitoxin [Nitrospinota bacterium]